MRDRARLSVMLAAQPGGLSPVCRNRFEASKVGLILTVLAIAITQVFGQIALAADLSRQASGRVDGTVNDALGRPLAGVSINLQAQDGHVMARTNSNQKGGFFFSGVKPGTYAIVARSAGFNTVVNIVSVSSGAIKNVVLSMAAQEALSLTVAAKRLDKARNSLSPRTGGSSYRFNERALQELPQGNNAPLNQVLLQAPGVVQDSFGQIHVRGDHADLQYRIDGVQLPEGITGFASVFSTRFANSIDLLDGALPAQFGYRTAGIVDIHTKSGRIAPGGSIEFYGGQRGTLQPSFELGGTHDKFSYYLTGTYFRSTRGIEPPTSGPSPIHDKTDQGRFFGDFSYFLNPTTRLTFLTGTAISDIQIPSNPGQPPVFPLAGIPNAPASGLPLFLSRNVRESQLEQNYFNVLALQGAVGPKLDYQLSAFSRYSTIHFRPDGIGDLIFNGAASDVFRSSFVNGLQGDASYQITPTDTVRGGFYVSGENAYIGNHDLVFPTTSTGAPSSNIPVQIVDNTQITDWLYGGYVQDEWHPVEPLTINFGARFDLSDAFVRATQFSPRFSLIYKLPTKTTLHAAYSRYFTPPQTEVVTDQDIKKFNGTTGAAPTLFNNLPVPERSHYFDVGITQQLGSSTNLGIDSFYKLSRDLLDEGRFGPALVFTPINYEKARVYGVEATGSYTKNNFYIYANFTYSVAQGVNIVSGQVNFDPDELQFIKNHYVFLDHDQTFSSSVGASYRLNGFVFTIDSLYGSGLRRGFANTGNLPPYLQVNVDVTRKFTVPKAGAMEARFDVVNLFDRTYQIRNGTGIGVFAAQYGPRRAVYCGLKWEIPFLTASGSTSR